MLLKQTRAGCELWSAGLCARTILCVSPCGVFGWPTDSLRNSPPGPPPTPQDDPTSNVRLEDRSCKHAANACGVRTNVRYVVLSPERHQESKRCFWSMTLFCLSAECSRPNLAANHAGALIIAIHGMTLNDKTALEEAHSNGYVDRQLKVC